MRIEGSSSAKIAILFLASVIYGCANNTPQKLTETQRINILSQVESGETRLDCELLCASSWGKAREKSKTLYNQKSWKDLAAEVARVRFGSDLTYYYLGRSMEELGNTDVALVYYNLGLDSIYKCASFINNCDGLSFPAAVISRIESMESVSSMASSSGNELSSSKEEYCGAYLGEIVQPISFDKAYKSISAPPPKSEFETIAEYDMRVRDSRVPGKLILEKKAEGPNLISYDAEEGVLRISKFAFGNMNVGSISISKHNSAEVDFDYNLMAHHSVPFSEKKISTDYYYASNSYGAQAKVQRDFMHAELAVDPRTVGVSSEIFKSIYPYSSRMPTRNFVIGEIKISPVEAKAIKEAASLAYVVKPSSPYRFQSKYTFPAATINSPYEKNYTTNVLIAELQCGLWLDRANKVIGAYPVEFD